MSQAVKEKVRDYAYHEYSHLVDLDSLFETAAKYISMGCTVIPVHFKVPVGKWKSYQSNLPTINDLEGQFQYHKRKITGLGIITGSASNGIAIRDFDSHFAYNEWVENVGQEIAGTFPTVRTYSGFHVYCRVKPKYAVYLDIGHGCGEFRADNIHYTLIPGSLNPKELGFRYEWMIEPDTCIDIPFVSDPIGLGLIPTNYKKIAKDSQKPRDKRNYSNKPNWEPAEKLSLVNRDNDFVSANFWIAMQQAQEHAMRYLPKRQGERNKKIVQYVRAIKGLQTDWTQSELTQIMNVWYGQAKDVIGTKDWRTNWIEFCCAFRLCDTPVKKLDGNRLKDAASKVRVPSALKGHGETIQLLAGMCKILSKWNQRRKWENSDIFFLSPYTIKSVLGVSRQTVDKMIKTLISKGIIKKITTGNNWKGEASSYKLVKF